MHTYDDDDDDDDATTTTTLACGKQKYTNKQQ